MSLYVNRQKLDDIGIDDVVHITAHLPEITNLSGNTIYKLTRYDLNHPSTAAVNISANGVVATNYLGFVNIWTDTEIPAEGKYLIHGVLEDPNVPISRCTFNFEQNVLVL